MYFSRFHALIALAFSILVTGCASPYPHVEEDFQTDWQSQEYNAQVHLLPSAPEALARRIDLVRNATDSIDLTYFSWDKDTVGLLLVNELKLAADRGVKVRLVLDDLLVFNEKCLLRPISTPTSRLNFLTLFTRVKVVGWVVQVILCATSKILIIACMRSTSMSITTL
ncbi:cardiolipin synthetase [Vibrio astriarenae]|nr:cardiolipin synthetase [Vibrio sp. C7]